MSIGNWIRRDGFLHGESCYIIVDVLEKYIPLWLAVVITIVLAIGVELWQEKHGGVASWHDIICDLGGIVLGVMQSLSY